MLQLHSGEFNSYCGVTAASGLAMKFALNRLDLTTPGAFAESAARAEQLGWSMGLLPCSPLLVQDPYVMLAFATQATQSLQLGTLLDTPVLRHPAVLASSIATIAGLAPNRVHLGLGAGDTAVRLNGLAPSTVRSLEAAALSAKSLLAGEELDVGAARPAKLRHAASVPLWIAAQGPKTLRMAGRIADGVWIRVGTHPENLRMAWNAVAEGARQASRSIDEIQLGLIFHTAYSRDAASSAAIARAIAAGYYEYSPHLFEGAGVSWTGGDLHELQTQVWPDFHHHRDMVGAGHVVDFLSDAAADAFALHGDWSNIRQQLEGVLSLGLPVDYLLPHPVLAPGEPVDFVQDAATELIQYFTNP